jgi:hypothetical protein
VDVRIDGDLLAEREAGDTFAELVHDADDLVARDQGVHGTETAFMQCRSVPHTPTCATLTRTWSGPASGVGTSMTAKLRGAS